MIFLHKIHKSISKLTPETVKKTFRWIYVPIIESMQRKRILRLYSQFINEGDLVFSVGANEGIMVDIFLELGAKVIAIEPNPDCIKILKNKYKDKEVRVVEKGVGAENGELNFLICEDNSKVSTYLNKWKDTFFEGKKVKRIKTRVTTLDNLIEVYGKPTLIQIDVEGYEKEVLKGLTQPMNYIVFEFTKEFVQDAEKCISVIKQIGNYEFNFSPFIEFNLYNKEWKEEVLYQLDKFKDDFMGDVFARRKMGWKT